MNEKNLIRVSDYVANFISDQGVKNVFMIVGGFSMHLVDAIANHPSLKYTCMHHEQALVMAAEGYARENGSLGVACVTAGPGATNTLTGVVGAHFDSIPCMVITGQTKTKDIKFGDVRQSGTQGFETLPLFEKVTKYAVTITDPMEIRFHLEKAVYIAKSGRPGPVWIEIPLDVQGVLIDPHELKGFTAENEQPTDSELNRKVQVLLDLLKISKKPLFLFGHGVRLAKAVTIAVQISEKLQIPIITSRLGIDCIESNSKMSVGRPGTYGERAANFAVQQTDLLIVVGCRLHSPLIGHNYKEFAKNAKIIVVDIDESELKKPVMAEATVKIKSDAMLFLKKLSTDSSDIDPKRYVGWVEKCNEWKKKYPVVLPEYSDDTDGVNSYYFVEKLSEHLKKDDTVVVDTSSCFHVVSQAIKIKKGERYITTGGLSTMGYAVPAAIGVCVAKQSGRVIAITGDGSLQMNLQELQTIVYNKLPIKLFVLNNDGYLLIRHTQNNFMEGRLVGESPKTGLSCPDLEKIAHAYGIPFTRLNKVSELDTVLKKVLESTEQQICEIMTPTNQLIIPRVASDKLPDGRLVARLFDDMYPFLDRKTYQEETNI
ncbi:MAG: thiamine pyrophosphate-binding protein [Candidatus Micrarchaeota archaeon]